MKSHSLAWATIHTIQARIDSGVYASEDELLADINSAVCDIQNMRPVFKQQVNAMKECTHQFGDAWYTERRQLFFEIMYKFKRKCIHCGYVDALEARAFRDAPSWAESATLKFENDDIL
jgi:hypothetical protein